MSLAEVEKTVKNLSSQPGVLGVLILQADGIPIRSTLEPQLAKNYASLALAVTNVSRRAVKQLSHVTYRDEEADQKPKPAGGAAHGAAGCNQTGKRSTAHRKSCTVSC